MHKAQSIANLYANSDAPYGASFNTNEGTKMTKISLTRITVGTGQTVSFTLRGFQDAKDYCKKYVENTLQTANQKACLQAIDNCENVKQLASVMAGPIVVFRFEWI